VPHPTSYYLEGNAHVLSLAQEQLRGGGDPRSDVYALVCCSTSALAPSHLFWMLRPTSWLNR
jgi:hypothetical protein